MRLIQGLRPDEWKRRVSASNKAAMKKRHQYPPQEAKYLRECCVFVPQTCGSGCFCRSVGCTGVWTVRPHLEFDEFADCYAGLWVWGMKRLPEYVERPPSYPGPRLEALVPLLRRFKSRWNDWNGQGQGLPLLVSRIRRCIFCDDAFEVAGPFIREIRRWSEGTSGVWASKLISQLFYDVAVPFDTQAQKRQERQGYDPMKYGDGEMQWDARKFLRSNQLTLDEFRQLDDAPERHWGRMTRPQPPLTACSRLFDKLFYP